MQFATFGLLGMFFYKALYRGVWPGRRSIAYTVFGVTCVGVTVVIIAEAIMMGEVTSDSAQNNWVAAEEVTVGIVFFALSLFFIFISVRAHQMSHSDYSRSLLEQSQRVVTVVTAVLFAVFASRSIFNFVAAAGKVVVLINTESVSSNIESFTVYAVWEIFPVCLLLLTIASGVPVRTVTYKKRQFGVIGTGDAMDAQSSQTSFDGYLYRGSSPDVSGGLALSGGEQYGSTPVVIIEGKGQPVMSPSPDASADNHSGKRRYNFRRGSHKASNSHSDGPRRASHSNRTEMEDVNEMSQPLLHEQRGKSKGKRGSNADVAISVGVRDADVLASGNVQTSQPQRQPHTSYQRTGTNRSFQSVGRGVKRGVIAGGAKPRVVSLAGDDTPYTDAIPSYSTAEYGASGSYGYNYMESAVGSYPYASTSPAGVKPLRKLASHRGSSHTNSEGHLDADPNRYDTPPSSD